MDIVDVVHYMVQAPDMAAPTLTAAASMADTVVHATQSLLHAAASTSAGLHDPDSTPLMASQPPSEYLIKRIVRTMIAAIVNGTSLDSAADNDNGSHLSSLLAYLISPFALLCMSMAVILNRTVVFATTRRPLDLPTHLRVVLRLVAIYSLAMQTLPLLRAIPCTLAYRHDAVAHGAMWVYEGIFGSVDQLTEDSCPGPKVLWDVYRATCTGHFIETFSSVIQGRIPYSETGMTLFEYSVAFQEVQSSKRLTFEILVVSLLSSLSQLALHIQGVFNTYRYRLVPSTVFGMSFLGYFAYSTYQGRILSFPTVCVIGYLPQMVILLVVVLCGAIYGLATVFAGGPSNLQTTFGNFGLDASDDFYTCLMKLGIVALTSATRATYLTESVSLSAPLATWIEAADRDSDVPVAVPFKSPYDNEAEPQDIDLRRSALVSGSAGAAAIYSDTLMQIPAASTSGVLRRIAFATRMVQSLLTIVLHLSLRAVNQLVERVTGFPLYVVIKDESVDLQPLDKVPLSASDLGSYSLLSGELLPDFDESDYEDDDDDDDDEDEDEVEQNVQDEDAENVPDQVGEIAGLLSTPGYLLRLLAPQSPDDVDQAKIMSSHLLKQERLTRSQYHRFYETTDSEQQLAQLIAHKRASQPEPGPNSPAKETVCVVCQVAPRQVVLWPCRCFALCEDCRLSLALKSFKGCVTCRRPVESFSKIYVP